MDIDVDKRVKIIENDYITLSDGTILSARFWMPLNASDENKVPAVLEFLPYRKRDITTMRDEINHFHFAVNGIAGVRVDMRGCGDSTGFVQDEYVEQEQKDACEVIDWISKQKWSNGNVGMMGISWGGFNSVQIAACQPPALKAVIVVGYTDDRYADDVHFKGGAMLIENLKWGATMEFKNSLPPDPEFSSDWKGMWLKRLDKVIPLMYHWFCHPTRDAYWKHGSICEDYSKIKAAIFVVGGYADGYTNAVLRTYDGLQCPKRALLGHWVHLYPQIAQPFPRWGFLSDAVDWWNEYLNNQPPKNPKPDRIMFLIDDQPVPCTMETNGKWIKNVETRFEEYYLSEGIISKEKSDKTVDICTDEHCGAMSGQFFPTDINQMHIDQGPDDELSCNFDLHIKEHMEVFGRSQFKFAVASDKPVANIFYRLCIVNTSGNSRLVAYGALNLNHDEKHEVVTPLTPGEFNEFTIHMDCIGEILKPGMILRLCIATSYWPVFLPNPERTTLTLDLSKCSFRLPLLTSYDELTEDEITPVTNAMPPAFKILKPASLNRKVSFDADGNMIIHTLQSDDHKHFTKHGLQTQVTFDRVDFISPKDPLSASTYLKCDGIWTRDDWKAEVQYDVKLTVDKENIYIKERRIAKHNNEVIFDRSYDQKHTRVGN